MTAEITLQIFDPVWPDRLLCLSVVFFEHLCHRKSIGCLQVTETECSKHLDCSLTSEMSGYNENPTAPPAEEAMDSAEPLPPKSGGGLYPEVHAPGEDQGPGASGSYPVLPPAGDDPPQYHVVVSETNMDGVPPPAKYEQPEVMGIPLGETTIIAHPNQGRQRLMWASQLLNKAPRTWIGHFSVKLVAMPLLKVPVQGLSANESQCLAFCFLCKFDRTRLHFVSE